ncbi:hypothetical protein HK407_08g13260 [Ordospora pajunii]|uniref:uncharacterized protein n=1 Tax=Ordospora pajunii TaxID=3039483 RepID=UPI0029528FC6|nr:uncharacterized protein HK407_08g13260 [Ordospora pajunii]KAH9411052.1 hypothetical protein HK407_08g13260 [Ordospora pajunii]
MNRRLRTRKNSRSLRNKQRKKTKTKAKQKRTSNPRSLIIKLKISRALHMTIKKTQANSQALLQIQVANHR